MGSPKKTIINRRNYFLQENWFLKMRNLESLSEEEVKFELEKRKIQLEIDETDDQTKSREKLENWIQKSGFNSENYDFDDYDTEDELLTEIAENEKSKNETEADPEP